MSRAEVRRSLLAIGVSPRVVDSIVAELPDDPGNSPRVRQGAPHGDEADVAAASVLADFERLLATED